MSSRAPQWPITPEWKAMIRGCMERLSVSDAELCRRTGISSARMSQIFNESKSSGMLPRIHKALGIPLPEMPGAQGEIDSLKAEIDENWRHLSEEEREVIAQMVRVSVRRHKT